MTTVTRFPPSPTGYLHIGGARTALFSWLYAKKTGGKFILRIEDTDRERSTEASVQAIFDGMSWLGLSHDEGPYYQTERLERYKEIIQQLLDQGDAYYCYCSRERLDALREEQMKAGGKPKYDGKCRDGAEAVEGVSPVVRFKNPEQGSVTIKDHVRGEVVIANEELDDLIIARSDGMPTYNLTVVVDDMDMGMTHVIRGDDHLNNTPRQINIFKALGAKPPEFAHVPMILGEDGKRMSKRHGAVSVMQYAEDGFLPEALLNYLVRLGWSHGDQEEFTIDEMIELFDLDGINKSASSFSQEKLLWMNQVYLKKSDDKYLAEVALPFFEKAGLNTSEGPALSDVIAVQKERVSTLVELAEQSRYFYEDFAAYDEKADKKQFKEGAIAPLEAMSEALVAIDDWSVENCHNALNGTVEKLEIGFGKLGLPLRVALTGATASPSLDQTLYLLGKDKSIERIKIAIEYIKNKK